MAERIAVALVDDNPLIADGFRSVVADSAGIDVVGTVASAEELATINPRPDVVAFDLLLEDGSAPFDNVAMIHSHGARALAFSSAQDRSLVQQAARAGAYGLVRKSSPAATIAAAIRAVAAGTEVFGADWAAAIDTDPHVVDIGLTERQLAVLAALASGETLEALAERSAATRAELDEDVSAIRLAYVDEDGLAAHAELRSNGEEGIRS